MRKPVELTPEEVRDLLALGLAAQSASSTEVVPTTEWRSHADEVLTGYDGRNDPPGGPEYPDG